MKKFSKILSVALLVALVLSLGVANAFAAGTDTIVITIDPSIAGDANNKSETYTAYKVFDVIKSGDAEGNTSDSSLGAGTETGYAYSISTSSPWYSTVQSLADANGENYFALTTIANDSTKMTVGLRDTKYNTEAYAKEIAAKLLAAKSSMTLTEGTDYWVIKSDTNNQPESVTVPAGYYLIASSLGSNLIAATTNIAIKEKNTYPSIDKSEKKANGTYVDDSANPLKVQVGDTISYQIVVFVPATTDKDIVVTDTMSSGLTPAAASTIVAKSYTAYDPATNAVSGTEGALVAADWAAVDGPTGKTYTITIHPTNNTHGKYIQFTFEATVNADAIVDSQKENETDLTYSNYYQPDTVKFDLYRTGLIKYDGNTADLATDDSNTLVAKDNKTIAYLSGAEFDLYAGDTKIDLVEVKDNDTLLYYRPATKAEKDAAGFTSAKIVSVNNSTGIVIRGLEGQKTYTLHETKAPDGFNLPSGNFELILEQDSDDQGAVTVGEVAKIKVPNLSGTLLPSTGGIGTTIFYVVGGVLVLAAIILLVTKKRMSE